MKLVKNLINLYIIFEKNVKRSHNILQEGLEITTLVEKWENRRFSYEEA